MGRSRAAVRRTSTLPRAILVCAAIALAVGCRRAAPPAVSTAQPHVNSYTDAQRAAWLAGRSESCRLIVDSMRRETGPASRACSDGRTNHQAIECAKRSFDAKQPFTLCNARWGMDSYFENGVAGLPNGNIQIYYLDTFGPRYRGTCLRPNVSFVADDWPRCRTALIHETDLQSGQPYVERPRLPNEESWPDSCAGRALRAPRSVGAHLLKGHNPLPNPEQWGLRCRQAFVSFEILIDKSGKVTCARIESVGLYQPPPGLYDSIRTRLLRWRFEPPTLHGEPLEVRWGMQLTPVRKGESIPGPQIYPECP